MPDRLYKWRRALALVAGLVAVGSGVGIRLSSLSDLRNDATGDWGLAAEPDGFLFARLATEIVEHGSLPAIDGLRYAPIGYANARGTWLHPYLIAIFHFLTRGAGPPSVVQSAALFPVALFVVTSLVYILLVYRVCRPIWGTAASVYITLIALAYIAVAPGLVHKTMAGAPDKESSAFFFCVVALYLYRVARGCDGRRVVISAALAGLCTAAGAAVWGGTAVIIVVIALVTWVMRLRGRNDTRHLAAYTVWLATTVTFMALLAERYRQWPMVSARTLAVAILGVCLLDPCMSALARRWPLLARLSPGLMATVAVVLLGAMWPQLRSLPGDAVARLVHPFDPSPLNLTIAENSPMTLGLWSSQYGPTVVGAPLTFVVIVLGAILWTTRLHKERWRNDALWLALLFFLLLGFGASRWVRLLGFLAFPAGIMLGCAGAWGIAQLRTWPGAMVGAPLILSILAGMIHSGSMALRTVAQNAPGPAEHKLHRAGAWLRTDAERNAVVAAWWDHGYQLQALARRATVLDNGNGHPTWNERMAADVLLGSDPRGALAFLAQHHVTHLLIDVTDLLKLDTYALIAGLPEPRSLMLAVITKDAAERRVAAAGGSFAELHTGAAGAPPAALYVPPRSSAALVVRLYLGSEQIPGFLPVWSTQDEHVLTMTGPNHHASLFWDSRNLRLRGPMRLFRISYR